jgi:chromosome partitioning protein
MRVITVMNQKGGVGKTTTTLNLAAALQEGGWRVLVVDFDPQGSLTTCCGSSEPGRLGSGQTIADAVLTTVHGPVSRPVSLRDVVVTTPAGIDLVPSSQQLATAEAALYTVYGREYALRDTLAVARDYYDVIIIDSVPTLGLLAVNGLAAADGLIIPVQAEYLAVYGLAQLLQNVALVRERLNPRLSVWGVLLTMVDVRTRHSREVVAAVRETLPGQVPVFETQIPVDVKLKDSSRAGISVLRYDSISRSAQAYRSLAIEVGRLLSGKPVLHEVPASGLEDVKPAAPQSQAVPLAPRPLEVEHGRTAKTVSLATRLGLRPQTLEPSWEIPHPTGDGVEKGGVAIPAARLSEAPESPPALDVPLAPGVVPIPDLSSGSLADSVFGGFPAGAPAQPENSEGGEVAGAQRDASTAGQREFADTTASDVSSPQGVARQGGRYDAPSASTSTSPASDGKGNGSERYSRSFKIFRRFDWRT